MSDDPALRYILLLVAYRGGNYSGFARQDNANTIAGELERALKDIDPEVSHVICASRTDRGVHARAQPVTFTSNKNLKARGWVLALAQRLPADISINRASFVQREFDPRKDPLFKRYRYSVFLSGVEDAFLEQFTWRVSEPLDLEAMKREAQDLVGEHDFRAFRHIDDTRTETVRRMDSVDLCLRKEDPRVLDITVVGNRFMYNMVRIIAGTLVDVGRKRTSPGAVRRALDSGERRELGMTAPPRGLVLEHVELSHWGEDAWPEGPVLSCGRNFAPAFALLPEGT